MFCPNCGNQLKEGAKFCSKCGWCLDKPKPKEAETIKQKKKSNPYLALIIILILALIAAGVGLVYVMKQKNDDALQEAVRSEIADGEEETEETEEGEETQAMEEIQAAAISETLATVAETSPALQMPTSAVAPAEPATISPTIPGQPISCEVQYSNQFNRTGLVRAGIRKETVTQSSYVVQKDAAINNSGWSAFDGQNVTSWQEGADGDGIGEYVYAGFDRQYRVRAITLLLGNHRSDSWYIKNNTPKTLTIHMGDQVFQASFPQEKTEFVLVFSTPVVASDMKLTIDDVYKGTEYSDTIIAEAGVYGS